MEENKFETLEQIIHKNEYEHPVLLESFVNIENPVMDTEGNIRAKKEVGIEKGIISRTPVNIIESADLRKVQKDYKRLEDKFDNMPHKMDEKDKKIDSLTEMFSKMMNKIDEKDKTIEIQNKIIENREQVIAEQAKRFDEQERRIEEFKKSADEAIKAANHKIEVLENNSRYQACMIETQKKALIIQEIKIEDAKKEIVKFGNENAQLRYDLYQKKLQEADKKEQQNTLSYRGKNKKRRLSDGEDGVNDSDLDIIPLIKKESIGVQWNPAKGIRDTFSIFTPRSVLHQEKYENELRKAAYNGDIVRVNDLIVRFQNIVNGRGMPDSICSLINSFYDKTALMLAAQEDHLECVKCLIGNDADVNFLDRDNFTALDYAQQNFHKGVSDFLKRHGAVNGVDIMTFFKEKSINDIVDSSHVVYANKRSYTLSFN